MNNPIRTYEELLAERQRLENLLAAQREEIRQGITSLKAEFKPALSAVSFLGSMFTRESTNPVLGTAANTLIDLLLKRTLLGRAGWLARTLVPALAKNLSSHYIAGHEGSIFRKLFSLLGRKRKQTPGKTMAQNANGEPGKV